MAAGSNARGLDGTESSSSGGVKVGEAVASPTAQIVGKVRQRDVHRRGFCSNPTHRQVSGIPRQAAAVAPARRRPWCRQQTRFRQIRWHRRRRGHIQAGAQRGQGTGGSSLASKECGFSLGRTRHGGEQRLAAAVSAAAAAAAAAVAAAKASSMAEAVAAPPRVCRRVRSTLPCDRGIPR